MPSKTSDVRVAYSPGEFAALFGKSQTWGYRQIYAGKVKAITEHGRMLIPAKEVEDILAKAGIYSGPNLPKRKSKAQMVTAWQLFIQQRRNAQPAANPSRPALASARVLARERLLRGKGTSPAGNGRSTLALRKR